MHYVIRLLFDVWSKVTHYKLHALHNQITFWCNE